MDDKSSTYTCSRCHVAKRIDEFYRLKSATKGFHSHCKECHKINTKDYAKKNKDKVMANKRLYAQVNKTAISIKKKQLYLNRSSEEIQRNRELQLERYHKGGEKEKSRRRTYLQNRRDTDPKFRIENSLRSRIRNAVKTKSESTIELLGCSVSDFVRHLESQFTFDMNWGNYGSYWEIDHIRPCCSFDLTNSEQQKQCFHYTNCRPLRGIDNRRKIQEDLKQRDLYLSASLV